MKKDKKNRTFKNYREQDYFREQIAKHSMKLEPERNI